MEKISFGAAMLHVTAAVVLWAGVVAWIWLASPRRPGARRDAVVFALVLTAAAILLGQPLWLTSDSTNDIALAAACEAGTCPTIGVLASHGTYEGGVLWDWVLAAVLRVSRSPSFVAAAFIALHALAAAFISVVAEDRRKGIIGGGVFFLVAYALAPLYIAWHPTLAPAAATPFVLLACIPPPSGKRGVVHHAAIGVAFGLSLGVYIATLFLIPLLVPLVLRLQWKHWLAALGGFVLEQLIVTPHAAQYNVMQVELDAIVIGVVMLVLGVLVRRRVLEWMSRRPFRTGALAAGALIIGAGVATGQFIYPYYFALLAPLLGGWALMLGSKSQRPKLEGTALGVLTLVLTVGSTVLYIVLASWYHEGRFFFRDLYDLGPRYRGSYGVATTGPSYMVEYSMRLWGQPRADDGIGVAIATKDDADSVLCDDILWSDSGTLGICEYPAWVRTSGATACELRSEQERCRTFESGADLELPINKSPIEYPKTDEHTVLVEFRVETCVKVADGPRTLRPLVYTGLPNRRAVKFEDTPPGGQLSEDGTEVTITPVEDACFPLVFRWDAEGEVLAPWVDEKIERDVFDQLVFMVEERRAAAG
ncbi:MAG: hypothetical protein AAF799_28610 [Myxococcota bacterium]